VRLSRGAAQRLAWFARERGESLDLALEQLVTRHLPHPPFPTLQNKTLLPTEHARLLRTRMEDALGPTRAEIIDRAYAAGYLGVPEALLEKWEALVVRYEPEWWVRLSPRPTDTHKLRRQMLLDVAKDVLDAFATPPRPRAPKQKTVRIEPIHRWDKTVALALKYHWGIYQYDLETWTPDRLRPEDWDVGRVTRNTKHFLAGDLVLVFYNNSQAERAPVTGYSGRGHSVTRLYMQFQRFKNVDDRSQPDLLEEERTCPGAVQILARPESCRTKSYASPDVRAWVSRLTSPEAARDSARGVSADSPSLSTPSQGGGE
jgi:hypothetical protein